MLRRTAGRTSLSSQGNLCSTAFTKGSHSVLHNRYDPLDEFLNCKDSRQISGDSLWPVNRLQQPALFDRDGRAAAAPARPQPWKRKSENHLPATDQTRSLMLSPLRLRSREGHSFLLRVSDRGLLSAIQAKRSLFDSLYESRFDPAGAHPNQTVSLHTQ